MTSKKGLQAAAVVSIILIIVTACGEKPLPERPEVARPIKMMTIGESGSARILELPGSVFASQSAELAFEVSGRMTERLVDEGQIVKAGDVVARIDPRDYESQRNGARARRDTAKADYDRYAKAFESNAVTEQRVSRAKGLLDISQAELDVAEKALADANLIAPFDGRIARRMVDDFANVRAKEPVLLLQDEAALEIRVDVAERDWARGDTSVSRDTLNERIKPRVEIAALSGRVFPAYIKELSTAADPVTRTYRVTFGFEPPADAIVSPGMTGKVVVDLYSENRRSRSGVVRIPASAVVSDTDGDAIVWVVQSSMRVRKQLVEVGQMFGDDIVVKSGLSSGDKVALSGVNSLTADMLVREMDGL